MNVAHSITAVGAILCLLSAETYERLGGDLHRHGGLTHSHHHHGPHTHDGNASGHGHTHGLIDPTIKRSRDGLRAVGASLAVLGLTALAQLAIFLATEASPCSPT